ncbi:MAG TPA: maleylpyruvate isomerase family mycothiol-dependent enzyme, partial [Acidimicrobiales bacterium]|nr:maleylpyruvate isomerase family mycothiol-dependent enzyme [Acidimicrobiales bacterium]
MATDPVPWMSAWRTSQDILTGSVDPLDVDQLEQRSYDSEWSIAQVLSHIGSQAETFGLLLDAGLSGGDPPGQDDFVAIWDRWNNRSPQDRATDALAANRALLSRIESLDDAQRDVFRLKTWGMDLDLAGLLSLRVGELAVHTWDVVVALDPSATVAPDSVALLLGTLHRVAGRGKPDGKKRRL